MAFPPTGAITLLFTDIEGSTRLLQQAGDSYPELLSTHRQLLRGAFAAHGGYEVDTQGDSFFVAFASASSAAAAATDAQRALANHEWPEGWGVWVRMGLHTGQPRLLDGHYVGLDVHHAARVMAAGHGGQVLVSEATSADLDDRFVLHDLGRHRLKDLLSPQRLFQLEIDGLPSDFPALKTLESRPTNLPVQPTPLIGRDRELAELASLFARDDVRLLTLTGPGGTGKTRLALQAAANLVEDFADGVFFVALASITDAALFVPAIVQALGLREEPGVELLDTAGAYLRDRTLLLVLDNLEQIQTAGTDLSELLQAAPKLKVIATSRSRLRLAAEHLFDVPPLELPDLDHVAEPDAVAGFEAVRLFVDRAQAARSGFALAPENVAAVAAVCVRLDGLPLALELAAARVAALSPQAILTRLDRRLKLLTGGSRDLEQRQQTLRAAIEWSHDLLSPDERALFARLAAFRGGCRIDAAEEVCDDGGDLDSGVFDLLLSLAEQSLLRRRDDPDGEPRFWMLETIREFAEEQLAARGEQRAVQSSHARHYLAVAEEAGPRIGEAPEWLDRLKADDHNFRAAVESSDASGDTELYARLVAAVGRFWSFRGRLGELRGWLEQALLRHSEPDELRQELLTRAAYVAGVGGDVDESERWARELRDVAAARDDDVGMAYAYLRLGQAVGMAQRPDEALEYLRLSEVHARASDPSPLLAEILGVRGYAALAAGDVHTATGLLEEAVARFHAQGEEDGAAWAAINLGLARFREGAYDVALEVLRESCLVCDRLALAPPIPGALLGVGAIRERVGDAESGAVLVAAANALARQMGVPWEEVEEAIAAEAALALRRDVAADRLAELTATGEALTLEQALALVLA